MSKRSRFRLSYSVVEHGGLRGRNKEIATLKKLYRACAQVSRVLVVEGKPGVGKTSLITSQEAVFSTDGHFVSGSFSERRQNEPFSAIVDALDELMEDLLNEEYSLDENSIVKEVIEKFKIESKNDAGIKAVLTNALPKFSELLQIANKPKRKEKHSFDMSEHSSMSSPSIKKKQKAETPVGIIPRPKQSGGGFKKGWNFDKFKIALRILLKCLCSPKRRVVLFLDNLHFADQSSLAVIEFLASGDGLSPVPTKDFIGKHDELDQVQGFFLILAYRNISSTPQNQNDAITVEHPFRSRLKELKRLGCPIHRIHVKDLEVKCVNEILATVTLNDATTTKPLAEVIYIKTGGNPRSVLEMIELLEHQGAIFFCTKDVRWKWKSVRDIYSATDLSDTIVDVVAKKLDNLPQATQQILMIGSCLGSHFRLEVVAAYFRKYNKSHHKINFAKAAEEAEMEVADDERKVGTLAMTVISDWGRICHLVKPVKTGNTLMDNMIVLLSLPLRQDLLTKRRRSTTYYFAHERLQSVAYALLPRDERQRKEIHWRLGKLMKEKSKKFENEHWMAFLATDQLNRGLIFLRDLSEKVELAQMNLNIAYILQEKSAFYPAAKFLRSAIAILFEESVMDTKPRTQLSLASREYYTCSEAYHSAVWKNHYELCLDLFSLLAEINYLLGKHKASKEAVDEVLRNAKTNEDKFRVQIILIESISAQQNFDAAINTCLKILATAYEMKLSPSLMKLQIKAEKNKVNNTLDRYIHIESGGGVDELRGSTSMFNFGNSSFSSTRRAPAGVLIQKKDRIRRGKTTGATVGELKNSGVISRNKSAYLMSNESRIKCASFPGNEYRFGALVLPKNEGRNAASKPEKGGKPANIFSKKQELAMMTLPKMTDEKSIRASKFLSQLVQNAILSGKTDLSAYVGLRSIRFAFQHGISPHSPMALAAYGLSQAKEGKYNEAFANGMVALKLLNVADNKEWHTRTIVKCHNLRHIKKPFHESLDPLMAGYRSGIESGDMEYALVAAMQYSLLYIFVGLPLAPLESDLVAFADQVHRYHLPFVLEVTFYTYREFVFDMQGIEHDKIDIDGADKARLIDGSARSSSNNSTTPSETAIENTVRPLIRREMCMMNIQKCYFFGEYEMAEKAIQELRDLPKFDYSVLRTINRDTFIGLVYFALANSTGRKKYRSEGQRIIQEFETYAKYGNVNSLHILKLLRAEDAMIGETDWSKVEPYYDEAINGAARSGFTNHGALANERAGRCLQQMIARNNKLGKDNAIIDQAKRYIERAMALYREWGATEKVDQLEREFPSLQPSAIMKSINIKARRRYTKTLTARFRDVKLHSGRWSIGPSGDLKILDGFDELKEDGSGRLRQSSIMLPPISHSLESFDEGEDDND